MKKVLLAGIVTMFNLLANAQSMGSNYRTALGVKFYPGAITIKHFLQPNKAIEGLAYFYSDGVRFTGLYEIHGDIAGAEGLKWYVGPGAHIGFWNSKYGDGSFGGIDGVLGLDYKFSGAPINLSIDWQPSFEFGDNRGFYGGWGGLGIRYTF